MTDFEQQIAYALRVLIDENISSSQTELTSDYLAPRVAAAISAAHGTQGPKALQILRADALRALRGT